MNNPVHGQDFFWQPFDSLLVERARGEQEYWRFLDNSKWSCGIYFLKAGEPDDQNPHELDELYYVLKGGGSFEVGDYRTQVEPGSILFVPAKASHRFHNITEDLEILVISSKRQPGQAPEYVFTDFENFPQLGINASSMRGMRLEGIKSISTGIQLVIEGGIVIDKEAYSNGFLYSTDPIRVKDSEGAKILFVSSFR